jgi:hypothetical protein
MATIVAVYVGVSRTAGVAVGLTYVLIVFAYNWWVRRSRH